MIFSFVDNLTLAVLGIAAIIGAGFLVLVIIAGCAMFFGKLKAEGNALKAWTVGIAILVVIAAGAKTWYFGK